MLFADKEWSELYVHLCTAAVGPTTTLGTARSTVNSARSSSDNRYLHWVEEELSTEGVGLKANTKPRLQLSLPLLRNMYNLVEGGAEGFFSDYDNGAVYEANESGEEEGALLPRADIHVLIETTLNGTLQRLPQHRMSLSGLVATIDSFFASPLCGLDFMGISEKRVV